MNDAGRIGFIIRGDYNASDTYDFLDLVYYNGASYVAKKETFGNEPVYDNEYWHIFSTDINKISTTFSESGERENIESGDFLSIIFGKLRKWYLDLKTVAFTGSYNDLSNKPTIPAAIAVKGNKESTYRTGNVNLTPANIGSPDTSAILTTAEQINANTNTNNIAGATAVKAMVSSINSNMANKVSSRSTAWLAALELSTDTPFIDFHYKNSTKDWTSRIIEESEGVLNIACTGLKMNGKPLFPVESGDITLNYLSSTKMHVRINLARTPVSLIIYPAAQTPYTSVEYACATRIGDYIECYAYGAGFVNGHVLSGRLYYI